MADQNMPYVSRGGLKLAAALDAFGVSPAGWVCADLGCSTGGFTDCLLQRGAARVYAVDTAYGQLAWKLRQDDRVSVLERTNALHFDPWEEIAGFGGCDLAVVDLGWTKQDRAVPTALRWLRPDEPAARVISLIKPHYEASDRAMGAKARGRRRGKKAGTLGEAEAEAVTQRVLGELPALGVKVLGQIASPIRGGKGGNIEHLALLARE